jgi:ABC-type transport system involved in multi-copper enzyme maturation permease subunit
MNWLLWREYRQNRWILAFGATGILVPYLIAVAVVQASDPEAYAKYFALYVNSYGAAWITIALLAGGAVAGGRADRSAEFLAYLPLPRWRVMASKMILPLLTFAAAWCVNLVFVNSRIRPVEPAEMARAVDLPIFASVLLAVFSGGWLFTQFLSSTFYAATMGALFPIAVGLNVTVILFLSGADEINALNNWVAMTNVAVAILCFGLGTWMFLRRTEP